MRFKANEFLSYAEASVVAALLLNFEEIKQYTINWVTAAKERIKNGIQPNEPLDCWATVIGVKHYIEYTRDYVNAQLPFNYLVVFLSFLPC